MIKIINKFFSKSSYQLFNANSKWTLRFLSLISGILLWSYVLNSTSVEEDKLVKLKLILPENLTFSKEVPDVVTLTLKGPRGFVRAVKRRDDVFNVDLNQIQFKKMGELEIDLKSIPLDLPFSVEVVKVNPAKLKLNLEQLVSKKVPLSLVTMGEVLPGHELKTIRLEPNKLLIWGPKSLVQTVDKVETLPVDLGSLTGTSEQTVSLAQREKFISYEQTSAQLYFDVRAMVANIELSNHPIVMIATGLVKATSHRNVKVSLSVKGENIEKFDASQLIIKASVPASSRGKVKVKLEAQLPKGVELVKLIPEFIEVTLD